MRSFLLVSSAFSDLSSCGGEDGTVLPCLTLIILGTSQTLASKVLLECMSYNPVAKQATAANASKTNALTSSTDASAAADADDSMFKTRTFDVFWVDKSALMYKDGFAKVRKGYCSTAHYARDWY